MDFIINPSISEIPNILLSITLPHLLVTLTSWVRLHPPQLSSISGGSFIIHKSRENEGFSSPRDMGEPWKWRSSEFSWYYPTPKKNSTQHLNKETPEKAQPHSCSCKSSNHHCALILLEDIVSPTGSMYATKEMYTYMLDDLYDKCRKQLFAIHRYMDHVWSSRSQ